MFYRLVNNKAVESFNTLPKFHPNIMATIIESEIAPQDDEKWDSSGWVPEFTEAELKIKAQDSKIIEIEKYAKNLIDSAYSNPVDGVTGIDPITQRERIALRRNAKADKLTTGDLLLTQAEKDEAKFDQKLTEFELKIQADSDKAIDNMKKLVTSTEINNFPVADENWTSWIAPV